ncbi:DUF2868 domain-containing protein [Glaciecola petra]|uniref:DUF2868 domain-containing protein n=1 Tax=Glaciecola petra TaxID=3075602 RepID=A0ABU2ZR02_9ALTE|nr:DUF2868 domain-containing protein [Aestuariibacter sp. P117]MDT0595064.1 DUF2868 domain-containing protein [Aestuariibacter sp. P117]
MVAVFILQAKQSDFTPASASTLSRPILIIGFLLGFAFSIGVLIGDDAGRVSLLGLMVVYAFVPLLGALLSVISLVKGKGINFARLLSEFLPSKSLKSYLHKAHQLKMDKPWFFLQSQGAALAYALSSFFVFILYLLITDMNFVWRSTILGAEQVLPLLELIALPWWFVESAQPSIELIRATQDSRLNESYTNVVVFGQWWKFVLATIFVYSFVLRGVLLFVAKVWLKKLASENRKNNTKSNTVNITDAFNSNIEKHRKTTKLYKLEPVTQTLPKKYALMNWASLSQKILSQLRLEPIEELPQGPFIFDVDLLEKLQSNSTQLLLVKAWEPPMGELQDYMEHTRGLLYPINYKKDKVIAPLPIHLEEWQRFTAKLPNWGIYQAATHECEIAQVQENQGEQNAE